MAAACALATVSYTHLLVKAKDEKGIKEEVEKTDRNRSAYYNYYTQNRWGDAHNYDLAINAALGLSLIHIW